MEWALTCIPLRRLRSLINEALHVITLWMAASMQGAHPTFLMGLGVSPSHALSIVALHVSTPSKEKSKHLFLFEDSVNCPQIVKTRGE